LALQQVGGYLRRSPSVPQTGAPLAAQSTISRLENAPSKTEAARLGMALLDQCGIQLRGNSLLSQLTGFGHNIPSSSSRSARSTWFEALAAGLPPESDWRYSFRVRRSSSRGGSGYVVGKKQLDLGSGARPSWVAICNGQLTIWIMEGRV
jgi:hypothetical protein